MHLATSEHLAGTMRAPRGLVTVPRTSRCTAHLGAMGQGTQGKLVVAAEDPGRNCRFDLNMINISMMTAAGMI